jgi:2-methylisocitrate lyase-like PEP mutase family enzyme
MTDSSQFMDRCDKLRGLHVRGEPLLLPNAWDVASARAVEAAGFPVVATTSGGVAAALGYEDHEGAPGEDMLAAAARIAKDVAVPVTVDADCVYPIALWEADALARFVSELAGPVNVLRIPPAPSNAELAELGVARISWGGQLARESTEQFSAALESLAEGRNK